MTTTTYRMHTYLLLAEDKHATEDLRDELLVRGFTGWTERETVGYWHGQRIEGQTEFEIQFVGTATTTLADALLCAHMGEDGQVYQLVHIAPDGERRLHEVRP